MYPIIDAETVRAVSVLRAALEADDPAYDLRAAAGYVVQHLTPDFQRDSAPRRDDDGRAIIDVATCGTCGRSWDDALGSSLTPVPSGRCPFEYEHEDDSPKARLEYLRGQLRAECMSWGEVHELQGLAQHIEPGDVELLEAAGVPEFPDDDEGNYQEPSPDPGWFME